MMLPRTKFDQSKFVYIIQVYVAFINKDKGMFNDCSFDAGNGSTC